MAEKDRLNIRERLLENLIESWWIEFGVQNALSIQPQKKYFQ